MIGALLGSVSDQVIGLLGAEPKFVHQGRRRPAALGQVHIEHVAEQVPRLGGCLQLFPHQAGIGPHRGHALGRALKVLSKTRAVHLGGDLAQGLQLLPRGPGLGGQLPHCLLVTVSQLDYLLGPGPGGGSQGAYGYSGGGQSRLERPRRQAAQFGHGGGKLFMALFRLPGGGLQLFQCLFVLRNLGFGLVHRRFRPVEGDAQVVRLFAVVPILGLCLIQLLGDELDLFGLGFVDFFQGGGLILQGLHAVLLALKGALAGLHPGVEHRKLPADIAQRLFILLVPQDAYSGIDAFRRRHCLSPFGPISPGNAV